MSAWNRSNSSAPSRLRGGAATPPGRLPPAPQLSMEHSEPPWRGPSPFEGYEDFENEVGNTQVAPDAAASPRALGPVQWLFRAAVVVFFVAIAIGVVRWGVFPNLQQAEQPRAKPTRVQTAVGQGGSPLAAANKKRTLSAEEVSQLINRGEASLAQGDVAAARLILERVAEAGDARAALKLGATYDPIVLREMNVVGIRPDPEQARAWYERAAEFGSREASQRLIALAQHSR
jgi:hypothetical protein